MASFKKDSEEAWKWLSNIPTHTWERHAMDTVCKPDLVVNNLSEDFNKMVLDVRSKPIKAMMEGLTANLMVKYEGIRENTE